MAETTTEITANAFSTEEGKKLFQLVASINDRLTPIENSIIRLSETVLIVVQENNNSDRTIHRRLDKLENRFDKLAIGIGNLSVRIDYASKDLKRLEDKVETKINSVENRIDGIETKFENIEEKFDDLEEYLKDTLTSIANDFSHKSQQVESDMDKINSKIKEIAEHLNYKFSDDINQPLGATV